MTGWLRIIGLGPGSPGARTPDADEAITTATDLLGYAPYLDRIKPRDGQARHATDNREELARARHALTLAADGRRAALVSGGDPGVFAMASAVFEALDSGPAAWRALDITVIPGITAMLAAAARLGAPLGHDFCAISLSDNLKPWPLVIQRLTAAAGAGFVIALYNPRSRARPNQLSVAFAALRKILPPATPVAFAAAITRPDERVHITTLEAANPEQADMRTLVLIGSPETRLITRENAPPFLYTPRSAAA
jgi:precorrin-3B C17-methyltransferase